MADANDMLADSVERISRELAGRGVQVGSPLPIREVEAFESRHRVRLPDGYRQFLLTVGDGGPGPPAYSLLTLADTAKGAGGRALAPEQTFPLSAHWVWEDDEEANEELRAAVFSDDHLRLGTDGCGMDWLLVVSGAERGQVWQVADVGAQPCAPRRDFLSWYEHWLYGGDDWFAEWDK